MFQFSSLAMGFIAMTIALLLIVYAVTRKSNVHFGLVAVFFVLLTCAFALGQYVLSDHPLYFTAFLILAIPIIIGFAIFIGLLIRASRQDGDEFSEKTKEWFSDFMNND